jgi:hypothetical protein
VHVEQSTVEQLAEDFDQIAHDLHALIADFGGPYLWNTPDPFSSVVIVSFHPYAWPPLDEAGQQRQTKIVAALRHATAVLDLLCRDVASNRMQPARDGAQRLTAIVEREETGLQSAEAAHAQVDSAVSALKAVLGALYHHPSEPSVFVPDTNALYAAPALEAWSFAGTPSFTLVLTPAVVADLDRHKVEHRVPDVREKAKRLIGAIKEYRRRGRLTEGVPVVKGRITLRALATEPRPADMLPWLDPANDDDRIIASTFELMRQHPRARVTLVTADVNLQNKAELSRLPFVEPPVLDPTT